jgi:putative CocE/NonD family hydrolase
VVVRTPYGKTGERNSQRAAILAKAGYACAFVDVRGRGDSDGDFQPYRNDGPDGAEVIAWAAAQDWCTGDVATYGASYGARIQWLTALEPPPALRAMACVVSPSDPFVEWPTGLPTPMHINWYRATDGRMPQFVDDVDWMQVYQHRPLLTMDEAAGFSAPMWREELRHRTLDEWWEPVRYQHRIGEIDVPVLHISGWYDDEQIGTPANFAAMVGAGRAGQRLLMGPWGHAASPSGSATGSSGSGTGTASTSSGRSPPVTHMRWRSACGTRAYGCPLGTGCASKSRPRRSRSSTSTWAPAGT